MKKNNKPMFIYYAIGAQIAITIIASVFIGFQLDKVFKTSHAPFTIMTSIVAILFSLIDLVQRFKKKK